MLTPTEMVVATMIKTLPQDAQLALCIALLSQLSKQLENHPTFKLVGFKAGDDNMTNAIAVISIIKNEREILAKAEVKA